MGFWERRYLRLPSISPSMSMIMFHRWTAAEADNDHRGAACPQQAQETRYCSSERLSGLPLSGIGIAPQKPHGRIA